MGIYGSVISQTECYLDIYLFIVILPLAYTAEWKRPSNVNAGKATGRLRNCEPTWLSIIHLQTCSKSLFPLPSTQRPWLLFLFNRFACFAPKNDVDKKQHFIICHIFVCQWPELWKVNTMKILILWTLITSKPRQNNIIKQGSYRSLKVLEFDFFLEKSLNSIFPGKTPIKVLEFGIVSLNFENLSLKIQKRSEIIFFSQIFNDIDRDCRQVSTFRYIFDLDSLIWKFYY